MRDEQQARPLTPDERAKITGQHFRWPHLAAHVENGISNERAVCSCGSWWPCLVARYEATLAQAEAEREDETRRADMVSDFAWQLEHERDDLRAALGRAHRALQYTLDYYTLQMQKFFDKYGEPAGEDEPERTLCAALADPTGQRAAQEHAALRECEALLRRLTTETMVVGTPVYHSFIDRAETSLAALDAARAQEGQ